MIKVKAPKRAARIKKHLPELAYVKRLTSPTGIVQHSRYGVPDWRHGYCLDDNARALLLMVRFLNVNPKMKSELNNLTSSYLSYINLCHRDDGWMHNFISYNQHFMDEIGSEDSFGRAIWGLGECAGKCADTGLARLAEELLLASSAHNVTTLKSLRAQSYALCGLAAYMQKHPRKEEIRNVIDIAVDRIMKNYHHYATPEWPWFEPYLVYSNAILPLALILCGPILGRDDATKLGLDTLDWLLEQTEIITEDQVTVAAPIGSDGWYHKEKDKAQFDQQPVDVGLTILACSEAYHLTKDRKYFDHAKLWYDWFLGKNVINKPVGDEEEGFCYDGINPVGINQNRGAESTILFLLAGLEMYKLYHKK